MIDARAFRVLGQVAQGGCKSGRRFRAVLIMQAAGRCGGRRCHAAHRRDSCFNHPSLFFLVSLRFDFSFAIFILRMHTTPFPCYCLIYLIFYSVS